ncbi:unnamed protein product (macronuclear) [Paramecium tetraurelia]|uniref:Protein kinase domain-containing protein n=1 Tax=Paramecium tetraurelia TaxID=5888 RepID=A0DC31_PARTE|nr:uncharacterized protein GSPATT00015475001 [Paramecium tetraurelia]CAK80598.1 unnamed protein product [Paramecium tetraurelia]|eukprot:XP_001447995.1 hypothetical protein (macronuclear) [Paramecium tetraurelia strain d4-2]
MGVQQSDNNEAPPFLSHMKMIYDKGNYKVYENDKNQKFDYQEFKSSQNSFKNELEVAQEIQNQNFQGIAKIEQISLQQSEKWLIKYTTLCILTEHPIYSLREYLQKKDKSLSNQQITELLVSITGAQNQLGMKKQYLGFDNIYTSDGNVWKLKPFFESESPYQRLMKYKAEKTPNFELDSFPAPEEFEGKVCDTDRVQIFGLGMIMLELITKQKSKDIYLEYKLNDSLLLQRVQQVQTLKQQFSGNLIDIIIEMLDTDLVRRPNFQQLIKTLKSPSSKIVFIQTKLDALREIPKLNILDSVRYFGQNDFNENEEQQISQAIEETQTQISNSIQKMKQELQNIQNPQTIDEQNGYKYRGQIVNNLYEGKGRLYSKSGVLIYEGEFVQGYFHNLGIQYYQNAVSLKDSYDIQNCKNIMKYAKQYEGSFRMGYKHGKGKLILTNGEYFCGEFKNDEIDGGGQFVKKLKEKIIGVWNHGILKSTPGFQKELISFRSPEFVNQSQISEDNSKQQLGLDNPDLMTNHQENLKVKISSIDSVMSKLQTCKNQLEGQIKAYSQYFSHQQQQNRKDHKIYYDEAKTKLKYEGQLFTGQMHGRGTLYFEDEQIKYQGDFVNGKFEGFGFLMNENQDKQMHINYQDLRDFDQKQYWIKYQGTFLKGELQGQGCLYFIDKSELVGFFEKNQVHGEGNLKRPSQEDVYAVWQNGILQKELKGKL